MLGSAITASLKLEIWEVQWKAWWNVCVICQRTCASLTLQGVKILWENALLHEDRTPSPKAFQTQVDVLKVPISFCATHVATAKSEWVCKLELFWVSFSFPTPSARGLIPARTPGLLLVGICLQCIEQHVQQSVGTCVIWCHLQHSVGHVSCPQYAQGLVQ